MNSESVFIISDRQGDPIPDHLIGLFFEDINYAADGGLYAEMLENRSFEAQNAYGLCNSFYTIEDPGYAWSGVCDQDGNAPVLRFVSGDPLSPANPHYLRMTAHKGQGFSNRAYDGIHLVNGEKYKISFYARQISFAPASVTVSVRKNGKVCMQTQISLTSYLPYVPFVDTKTDSKTGFDDFDSMNQEIRKIDPTGRSRQNDWIRYEAWMEASADVTNADFVITADADLTAEFDLISLMPGNAVAGVFRKDLFEALKEMKPGFLRFPGGCIVEGISLYNRYRWKNTIGDLKDRKYIPNLWAFDDNRAHKDPDTQRKDSHYGQSFGSGFYEYFLMCEMIGAEPVPVLNTGLACQFRSTELVSVNDSAFAEYIQDALDLIEFANGPADSRWGSVRAIMGHPESFHLKMISIGNEQWETKYVDYFKRYELFEKAIHDDYPEILLISSVGPFVDLPVADQAWEYFREKTKDHPNFCYAVDEHYYLSPENLSAHADLYDDYPDHIGVFVGEYAAHTEGKKNTMEAALAEAALLTGIEKNARKVRLASYAPLFNRIGHSQWVPDMIWFNDEEIIYTASYYVQKLFCEYLGQETIPMDGQEAALREKGLYISASRKDERTILKIVNESDEDRVLAVKKADGSPFSGNVRIISLAKDGPVSDCLPQPVKLTENVVEINGDILLNAETFYVICSVLQQDS